MKDSITFNPCGERETQGFEPWRLLRVIGYSQSIDALTFTRIVTGFLNDAVFRAEEQGLTLNEFAICAFQQALGWELKHRSPVLRAEIEEMLAGMLAPIQQRLEELEQRLGEP